MSHDGCTCVLVPLQVANHRARGIHNKASNGIISNNIVQNSTLAGMITRTCI